MGGINVGGRIESERIGADVGVVALLGEHDMHTAVAIAEAIATFHREGRRVVVDLSQAEFIDSSVIHVLSEARKRMGEAEWLVIQASRAPVVATALRLTGIASVLASADSREEAVRLARAG